MWTLRRCADVKRRGATWLLAGLLAGCAADDSGGAASATDDGAPRDAGPRDALVCPVGEYASPSGCQPVPGDPCPTIDALGLACTDRDGDCLVVACPAAPAGLLDCDDDRFDVGAGRPERCDEIDNDCDGMADEGFTIGDPCDACGPGKVECSTTDPSTTACSTSAGQSEAPEAVPEVCNGLDEDCDGQVDEACRLESPAEGRSAVALCGDDLLVIEGAAQRLVRISLVGGEPEILDAGPAGSPACEGSVFAWLKIRADRPCGASEGGAVVCPQARLFARAGDGSTEDLTGLGDLGPPVVGGGFVYWHTALEGGPVLQRRAPGGPIEPLFEGAQASDPTRPVMGRMAVRTAGPGVPVAVRGLDGERDLVVEGPAAPAGPPALDAHWVAWVVEGPRPAVWAVPLERPREGFQLTTQGLPQGRLWLDAQRLFWIDADGLWRFDLETGETDQVVAGPLDPAQVDVVGGRVVWLVGEGVFLGP